MGGERDTPPFLLHYSLTLFFFPPRQLVCNIKQENKEQHMSCAACVAPTCLLCDFLLRDPGSLCLHTYLVIFFFLSMHSCRLHTSHAHVLIRSTCQLQHVSEDILMSLLGRDLW